MSWSYANREKERKFDFYNRIIEFKAKNKTIKMNLNYRNVYKKIWKVKGYLHYKTILCHKAALDV